MGRRGEIDGCACELPDRRGATLAREGPADGVVEASKVDRAWARGGQGCRHLCSAPVDISSSYWSSAPCAKNPVAKRRSTCAAGHAMLLDLTQATSAVIDFSGGLGGDNLHTQTEIKR